MNNSTATPTRFPRLANATIVATQALCQRYLPADIRDITAILMFTLWRPGGLAMHSLSATDVSKLVQKLEELGGVADIVLTHRDDVADAQRYARHFDARVWIHEDDRSAAPYATRLLRGMEPVEIQPRLLAIPLPGHTRGSVVFLLEETYLFSGDSLAWHHERADLQAFRDACWYSWSELKRSLTRLADHTFEWVLAGHGGSARLPAQEMHERLRALVERM